MVATVVLWATYVISTIVGEFVDNGLNSMRFILEAISYVIVMTFLTFSAMMYLTARQGALYRARSHVREPRAEIDAFFDRSMPTMTVLVPSYCEDPEIVRTTLLSVALQEYPFMRVVLLIDDPRTPKTEEARLSLEACRRLPEEVCAWLAEPRERFEAALSTHESTSQAGSAISAEQIRKLADEYRWAANWLFAAADEYPRRDHIDEFVGDEVLRGLATDFASTADALHSAATESGDLAVDRITQLYRRLAWTFRAEITSFERKAYASLSHEANKAMNLNAYIGLMGRSFTTTETPAGLVLRQVSYASDLTVPDTDYVLTLDADSVLLREYCLRLVHFLEQPQNSRVAVTQTPYSAFRGAATRMERIAGATTDIQHILHQGMSYFGATFWVGANAVIRKTALDDIVEVEHSGGREIRRYVQDRTVIEDTESSIDLVARGWTLVNYPERLSYSATPPDFGSLSIQRARWANGGLLILPKFWRYVRARKRAGNRVRLTEIALRVNYMASICWASFGLIFLLVYPYDSKLLSPIILAAAIPYFLAQASDFHRLGYKRTDIFRVYGFNLILLPVNLAGVLKSLQQAAARSKIPFARTPKVGNRTATPLMYVLAVYLIVFFSLVTMQRDLLAGNWGNAAFAGLNAALTLYAIGAFIGFRNTLTDVVLGIVNWVRVPSRRAQPNPVVPVADWQSVLYFGADDEGRPSEHLAAPVKAAIVEESTSSPVLAPAKVDSPDTATLIADLVTAMEGRGEVEIRLDGPGVSVNLRPTPAQKSAEVSEPSV